jgi:hypothetical protein
MARDQQRCLLADKGTRTQVEAAASRMVGELFNAAEGECLLSAEPESDPGKRGWDSLPDPTIHDPSDIVVEVATTTICGSDVHILKGRRARDGARTRADRRRDLGSNTGRISRTGTHPDESEAAI